MTIICIRDNIIAADGAVFCDNLIDVVNVKKISRSADGALGACAGLTSVCQLFRNLFLNSTEYQRAPGNVFVADLKSVLGDDGFQAIWLEPTGEIRRMLGNGLVSDCGETMAAVGSSEEFAIGAMRAGASAEEAVRLCIEFTVYAAGEVQVEGLIPSMKSCMSDSEAVRIWQQQEAELRRFARSEQEPESSVNETEIGFEISGWPEESPGPSSDIWKDKQGLK